MIFFFDFDNVLFDNHTLKLYPQITGILKYLYTNGHKLYIISYNRDVEIWLKQLLIDQYIHAAYSVRGFTKDKKIAALIKRHPFERYAFFDDLIMNCIDVSVACKIPTRHINWRYGLRMSDISEFII